MENIYTYTIQYSDNIKHTQSIRREKNITLEYLMKMQNNNNY